MEEAAHAGGGALLLTKDALHVVKAHALLVGMKGVLVEDAVLVDMNDALLVGMKGGVSGALAARRGRAVGRLLLKEEALLEDMKDVLLAEEAVLVEMEEAEHVLLAEDAVLVEHVL
ncbi:hypothetical protein PR002_g13450, partial [Phytophthora rubi]